MHKLALPLPPKALVNDYERVAMSLFERRRVNRIESGTLATLRDTLLPKLISGELRVPEAEGLVSPAVVDHAT